MEPSSHPVAIMGAMGAAMLTGVALWFGTGLHPAWWLTWLAIVPVLLVAARSSARIAFFVAGAAWLAGGLNVVRLYAAIMPVILIAILVALPARRVRLMAQVLIGGGYEDSFRNHTTFR